MMLDMVERRKRGGRYHEGYIKKQIIRFVCDYPGGIGEPKIRDWLKENYGISEGPGIRKHLEKLEEKRVLIKQKTKVENIWKPNPDPEMSKKVFTLMMKEDIIDILREFHKTNRWDEEADRVTFFFTKYFQGAIEKDFLPFFKNDYGISLIYDKLPKEIRNFIENGIKLSPTAAKHIIGRPVPEVKVPVAMLLAAGSKNTLKEPDKLSVAIATVYSCLLIDLVKYCSCPVAREKIRAFLEDSNTVSALSDCLNYDLSHFTDWLDYDLSHFADRLVDNYLSLKAD